MLKNSRFSIFSIMMVVAIIFITACSNDSSSTNKEQESTGDTRTIEHAMGTTDVNGTPEKVVVLTNEGTEAVLALGIKPVGAVKSWMGNPWYEHIKSDMEGVTVLGDEMQPNLDEIAKLQPDLILGTKVRQEKVYDQLSRIAPTVFSESLSGNWQDNFKLYAEALNKKEEGDKLLAEFDTKIQDSKRQLSEHLSKEISIIRFLPASARIYMKDSFSGVILDQLGFARPEVQQKNELAEEVTKERIPDMDGDVLFYFVWEDNVGETKGKETAEEWMNDDLWKNLEVVKNNQVHEVSDATWNTSGGILSANIMVDDLIQTFTK